MLGIRKILMTSSYPPFLGMVLMTSLGLIILLEETALMPQSLSRSATTVAEMPAADTSSEIIIGKRISSIRKVEDFIIKRAPMHSPHGEFPVVVELEPHGNVSFIVNISDKRSLNHKDESLRSNRSAGLSLVKLSSNQTVSNENDTVADNKSAAFTDPLKTANNGLLNIKDNTRLDQNISALHSLNSSKLKVPNENKNKVARKNNSKNENKVIHARHLGDSNSYFLVASKHRSKLHDKIVKQFTLKADEPRDSFINLHRYGYALDSSVCDAGKPKFVILVHSKFNNFVKRARIRSTYAKNKTVSGVEFAVTFILGQPNSEEIAVEGYAPDGELGQRTSDWSVREKEKRWNETVRNLQVESKVFKDIVMGNFTDSYRNLTTKHILAYDWVLRSCKDLMFVLKVDDDILVNTYQVARLVKQTVKNRDSQGLLVCDVPEKQNVMRGNQNKWYVSQQEYPFRFYPPWCKGYGVFMSTDVVQKLYRASSDVRNFWIDDVYVTGILAWRARIQVRNFRRKQTTVTHNEFEAKDIHAMFVWASFDRKHSHRAYWKAMVAAQEKL